MIYLLEHILTAVITFFFDNTCTKWVKQQELENQFQKTVFFSKSYGIMGAIWFLLFFTLGILGLCVGIDDTDADSFFTGCLFLLISFAGIFLILLRRNYRIEYSPSFICKRNIWGKEAQYALKDLHQIRIKGGVVTVDFEEKTLKFLHNSELIGSTELLEFLQLSHEEEKIC
ncbi:MAG: hypothetical protein ACI4XB_08020 [Ruminococcus sp.]